MTTWRHDEISNIGESEELEISSLRDDGTLRNPVIIWVVRVNDNLYVRSVNGVTSTWFRGVQARHEGRISAGGLDKDVTFVEETDSNTNNQIDSAYRTKYRRYAASIISHITSPDARAATIKLIPHSKGSLLCNEVIVENPDTQLFANERFVGFYCMKR
jgi:hypothetical protein